MTTKNIKDVVAERVEEILLKRVFYIGDNEWKLIGYPQEFIDELTTRLTQLVKEVEAGEREKVSDTLDAVAFQTMHEKRYSENMENGLTAHKERCMCITCSEATRHAEMATIEQIAEALT